ncbi:TetR/AcrR family transcriptional regulator [Aurantibacter sp.]|uniref:TetR/AcrR family transcriptional regulator n=1 Tax=Aurantibacter sp. TaxID=2807103 RepID=UPI00326737C4
MNKTKQTILETALLLFNSDGLSVVTLRTIANKMKISQGNLNYHFKKRDDIIEALYFELVEHINKSMEDLKLQDSKNNLKTLADILHTMMTIFYEYRFFFLDFVQIMRGNKKIEKHYTILSKQREEQFSVLFKLLVKNRLMRNEALQDEYNYLYKRFSILGNFWISEAEIQNSKLTKKMIATYAVILFQAIYPYLTLEGQKEYNSINFECFNLLLRGV